MVRRTREHKWQSKEKRSEVDETILSEKETEELVQYIMGVRDLDATEYDSILEMLREVASKN